MGQRSQIYIRYNINYVIESQNLIWDTQNCYEQYRWTETETPTGVNSKTVEYTLDNIDYIRENATLMTEDETKEFINADYSYLFAPKF